MPTGPQRRYDPMIDKIDDLLHYQNVVDRAFPRPEERHLPEPGDPGNLPLLRIGGDLHGVVRPQAARTRVGRVPRQRGDEFMRGITIRDPGGRASAPAPKTTIVNADIGTFTVYDRGTAAHLARPAGRYQKSPSQEREQGMRKRIRIRPEGLRVGISDLYGARPGMAEPRERTLISKSHSATSVTYGVNPLHFNQEGRPAGEVRRGTPSQRRDRERHG